MTVIDCEEVSNWTSNISHRIWIETLLPDAHINILEQAFIYIFHIH